MKGVLLKYKNKTDAMKKEEAGQILMNDDIITITLCS